MSTEQPRKPRVAVVFGGRSSEHSVSCATAAGVLRAVDRSRYDVIAIGITRDGRWTLAGPELEHMSIGPDEQPEVAPAEQEVRLPMSEHEKGLVAMGADSAPVPLGDVDVVFPLLHGPFGEDGTIQGLFEMAGIRYVGSGVFASAVMMDKHHMKVCLAAAGLPVGPYEVVTDRDWMRDPQAALDRCAHLQLPLFVKPARAGSSVGITRVADLADLRAAIETAREHDPKVVVEEGIVGREIECGVLGGRGVEPDRASELGEIVVTQGHTFYDFEAKYLAEADVQLSCPADVPEDDARRIREMAVDAFHAADCEGLARVDFFYTPEGRIVVNEVNTMPGFTSHSMYPQMWAATGIEYRDLISELIELALQRRVGLR